MCSPIGGMMAAASIAQGVSAERNKKKQAKAAAESIRANQQGQLNVLMQQRKQANENLRANLSNNATKLMKSRSKFLSQQEGIVSGNNALREANSLYLKAAEGDQAALNQSEQDHQNIANAELASVAKAKAGIQSVDNQLGDRFSQVLGIGLGATQAYFGGVQMSNSLDFAQNRLDLAQQSTDALTIKKAKLNDRATRIKYPQDDND